MNCQRRRWASPGALLLVVIECAPFRTAINDAFINDKAALGADVFGPFIVQENEALTFRANFDGLIMF